jgi:FixJ family two-component response regulator
MRFEATVPLIAIVDDDESVRSALDSLIRSAGYRSVTFESGAAFLDSDQDQEIGCLILDIDMPGLNGLDVQRRLAEINHSIPIIFVTGHDGELQRMALQKGAFAVIGKSCSGSALLQSIHSALGASGS